MATSADAAPAADTGASVDNISLRVIILAYGTARDHDFHLVVPLEMTVMGLKDRLAQVLADNPPPESQRLIYQGRPLLDTNATLRSVLRLQSSQNQPVTSHVLHLIIRSDANAIPPRPSSTQPNVTNTSASSTQTPHVNATPQIPAQQGLFPLPPIQAGPDHHAALAQMMHQRMVMQQHMAIHNQHLAQAHHHALDQENTVAGTSAPTAPIHPPFGVPHAHNVRLGPVAQGRPPGAPHGENANPNGIHFPQPSMTVRVEETILPSGERIRTVTNSGTPGAHTHLHPPHATPVERSASAPGTAQRSGTPNVPNGGWMPSRFPTGMMTPRPDTVLGGRPSTFTLPNQMQTSAQAVGPTVWLLAAPTGPQALLFAPGHGFFSSLGAAQQNTVNTQNRPEGDSVGHVTPQQDQRISQTTPPAQDQRVANGVVPRPGGEVVLRPQAQVPQQAQPAGAAQVPNGDVADLAGFIMQRLWLLARLYMFIFVFSESGSWRRIILLGLAIIVSLLPRENFLFDLVSFLRHRFEDLVGPPDPPQRRPAEEEQRQDNARTGANANGQPDTPQRGRPEAGQADRQQAHRTGMPTPEESARRLLQERQRQNQISMQNIIRPIQRAAGLFLASLIPGVGERHVQAAEAARRVATEEEEARRRAAEEAQSAQQPNTDTDKKEVEPTTSRSAAVEDTPLAASATTTSTSTSTDAQPEAREGLRHRTVDGNPSPAEVTDR